MNKIILDILNNKIIPKLDRETYFKLKKIVIRNGYFSKNDTFLYCKLNKLIVSNKKNDKILKNIKG
ncbi:MAG TPA: hypothetical protein EYG89_02615 [Bacteroidia bacterium]|nr:hypothetical protein [Bacteroidia bacterium]